MKLHLQNRFDNKEYDLTIGSIWIAVDPNIFQFNVTMPEGAAFGEYNYTLTMDEGCAPFETGILKYRPDQRLEPVEYHRDITYLSYEGK